MSRIAVLVPPSEGEATGGDGPPWAPGTDALPELDAARAKVLRAVGGGIAAEPTMPAIGRFTGVLDRQLDRSTLPAAAKRRGRASLLVVSGLWGAVGPADPIPYHEAKMSASLPRLGKLSTWKPQPTAALAERRRGRVVCDLLPDGHGVAWEPWVVAARRWLAVRVVDDEGRTVEGWVHASGHHVEVTG